MQDFHLAQLTWAMRDDPHGSFDDEAFDDGAFDDGAFDDGAFDDGPQPAVLCATAIEYGLIAAL